MSHWVSVYCRRRVDAFSAGVLETAIRQGCTDYRGHNYFSEVFARLNVKSLRARKGDESSRFHITWQLAGGRPPSAVARRRSVPIVLDRVAQPDAVRARVEEQLEEYLRGRRGPKAALVRKHLADVAEIYSFALKASHADEAGRIVVCAAREFLAQQGKGMVREDGVGWLQWTRHGFFEALRE